MFETQSLDSSCKKKFIKCLKIIKSEMCSDYWTGEKS